MSLDTVKREINRFLESDAPEVLVIKGAWGVGKTFSWNKLLRDAQNAGRIKLNKYSYVSLFGINSLDLFKFSIFEQQINTSLVGTEPSLETFKENTASILSSLGKKSYRLWQGLPFARSIAPALESISYLSLAKTLICVDDFERKGNDLSPKDILGLISSLKEQKKCKVVLILNDSSFEDSSLEEYEKYKEKVVDVELLFDPAPEECVDIALDKAASFSSKLKQYIVLLKVNNIRIIKRIERLASLLDKSLSRYEQEVVNQALHSLVLFSWSYYAKGEEVPSPDYIKNIGYKMLGLDKNEVSDQEQLWQTILSEYDYRETDELDLIIAKTVETGFIDEQALQKEAAKSMQQAVAKKCESSFLEAWGLYHDSFDNNEEEVVQGIYDSFKKNTECITPMNLNGTVTLLRSLGKNKEADELIDHYIEVRKGDKKLFDLDEYAFASHIDDKTIIEKFCEIKEESKDHRTIREVLEVIAGKRGWGGADAETLANASADDYYNLFKSEKGGHLSSWVNTCLKFGLFTNASNQDKKIAKRATEALLKVAGESKINALRVAKFGVKIDDAKLEENAEQTY